jgi:hypothetical protein
MSNLIEFQVSQNATTDGFKPLDATVWRRWITKNSLEEKQGLAARLKVIKWACIYVLIISVVVSSSVLAPYVSAYQTVVQFAITLGAVAVVVESFRARQYAFTALFAGLILLFNPLFPTFTLSGNGSILFATAILFFASLVWTKKRPQSACSFPAATSVS